MPERGNFKNKEKINVLYLETVEKTRTIVQKATVGRFGRLTSLAEARNQSLAEVALLMVSWVVNVLDATMNRLVSGSSFLSVSARCVPSTLDTKCTRGPTAKGRRASVTIRGPWDTSVSYSKTIYFI